MQRVHPQPGRTDKYPELKEILSSHNSDLEELWTRFGKMSRRLELISHKQLRQVDLNESEEGFIKSYGKDIAAIMMYGGNSYKTPRDDAPRVVDVYANYQDGGYLHAGVSRPRKMYVLYPWKGKTVRFIRTGISPQERGQALFSDYRFMQRHFQEEP